MKKFFILILAFSMAMSLCGCSSGDYKKATNLYNQGQYEEAQAAFEALGDYEDSATMVKKCQYQLAKALYDQERYEEAQAAFEALGDFEDSNTFSKDAKIKSIINALIGTFHSEYLGFNNDGSWIYHDGTIMMTNDSSIEFQKKDDNTLYTIMDINLPLVVFKAEGNSTVQEYKNDKDEVIGVEIKIDNPTLTGDGWSKNSPLRVTYFSKNDSIRFEFILGDTYFQVRFAK